MTEDSWDSDEATRFSPRITGPRRWCTGPLDVEGLAISAVSRALEAANAVRLAAPPAGRRTRA